MPIKLCRTFYFNAAHRLYNKNWDDAKNFEFFGKCANPNYHGHNYNLIVKITGEINPETGFVFSIERLKKIVKQHIEEKLDHKNLNIEVDEFKKINPSVENLAIYIWNNLRPHIEKDKNITIILYETPRNFAEYSG